MTSGHIKIALLWPFALLAFVMALMGAWSLRAVSDADWLDRIVPILLFAAAFYYLVLSVYHRRQRITRHRLAFSQSWVSLSLDFMMAFLDPAQDRYLHY